MGFEYFKAFHLVFMVAWFAGLFYVPRLYIYFVEAAQKEENEKLILQKQFLIMMGRLWHIITWPAMILTIIFGTAMLVGSPWYLKSAYMHVKLTMVLLLVLYHVFTYRMYLKMKKGEPVMSSGKLRLWNEIATLLLFGIVFVIVFKTKLSWIWAVGGFFLLAIILMLGIRFYKRQREKKK